MCAEYNAEFATEVLVHQRACPMTHHIFYTLPPASTFQIYLAYCRFGDKSNTGSMDGRTWKKLVTDVGLVNKSFTTADIDLTFTRHAGKTRKLDFNSFQSLLGEVAGKLGCTASDLSARIVAADGPKSSGTQAEQVRFHDDKGTYTGVHTHGGPTTNDDRITLGNLLDRSAADARGVQLRRTQ